ncbi:MAG: hypothetical protein R3E01_36055 [Pirellulaceae bacterium]
MLKLPDAVLLELERTSPATVLLGDDIRGVQICRNGTLGFDRIRPTRIPLQRRGFRPTRTLQRLEE